MGLVSWNWLDSLSDSLTAQSPQAFLSTCLGEGGPFPEPRSFCHVAEPAGAAMPGPPGIGSLLGCSPGATIPPAFVLRKGAQDPERAQDHVRPAQFLAPKRCTHTLPQDCCLRSPAGLGLALLGNLPCSPTFLQATGP